MGPRRAANGGTAGSVTTLAGRRIALVGQPTEARGETGQLLEVERRQLVELCHPRAGKRDANDPAVVGVAHAPNETESFGPVDELNGAVMTEKQMPGDFTNGRRVLAVMAPDGQEQLMLSRGKTHLGRALLTPEQETTQARPNVEQLAVVVVRRLTVFHIVIR